MSIALSSQTARPHRILVAEDEPGIALGLEDTLRFEGYEVDVVANGERARQRALEQQFDLILRSRDSDWSITSTTDDRKIVFYAAETNSWVEWDVSTGEERPVPFYRTADGRWSLSVSSDSDLRKGMRIRPATWEGDWRFLVGRKLPPPGYGAIPVRFSPDGNWLVYHDRDSNDKDALYRIATTGGEPQRLGDYPTSVISSVLSVRRDGRRFIVHAPKRGAPRQRDFWVLENFLPDKAPATTAKK